MQNLRFLIPQVVPARHSRELLPLIIAGHTAFSVREKLEWIASLVFWIQSPPRAEHQLQRFRSLLSFVSQTPSFRQVFRGHLRSALIEGSSLGLFDRLGIHQTQSPPAEIFRRIRGAFHGPALEGCSLADWIVQVIRCEEDLGWLRSWTAEDAENLRALIEHDDGCRTHDRFSLGQFFERKIQAALQLLSKNELPANPTLHDAEKQSQVAQRMLILFDVSGSHSLPGIKLWTLLLHLAEGALEERRIVPLFNQALAIEARNIAHRTARRGDRFVARSRAQYFALLRAGGGGGLVTCLTVIGKFLVSWTNASLLLGGVLVSANYAGCFLLMHAMNFKLVTKQPALAAAALAHWLDAHETDKENAFQELLSDFASIFRSLFATAFSNLAVVTVSVVLFQVIYSWFHPGGHAFLDAGAAKYTLHSMDPARSMTLAYAAYTGVALWLSSVVGGWFESRRSAGVAACVSLGLFLGWVPAFATSLGIPLEVRHTTLSSGAVVMAVSSIGLPAAINAGLGQAFLGLAATTFLNLMVAFFCGLFASIHARGMDRRAAARLINRLFRGGIRWRELLLPPIESQASA